MSHWFYLNTVFLLFALWKMIQHEIYGSINTSIVFGFLAFLLFMFNWTRNAVFSTIRNAQKRSIKIKLVNISKRVVPFHRWVGTIALIIAFFHSGFIINHYGFYINNMKMTFGLLSLINLTFLVGTGWFRFYKPSGKLRRLHLRLGVLLFILLTIHLLY